MSASAEPTRAEVTIDVGDGEVVGDLTVPVDATGVVAFAHGSGSSRHSGRNLRVADGLREASLATLLVDLLTPAEDEADRRTREHRFDIVLLTRRVAATLAWLRDDPRTADLRLGLFGASTGAAAALAAAADEPAVAAVVSRGGRPDLAGDALARVRAPTLLIVGGADHAVLELNERALAAMRAPAELVTVPGATHLFEEPGALEQVTRLARDHLTRALG